MPKIRFKASHPDLSVPDIRVLRQVCPLGFADMKRRAREGAAIIEFGVFDGDWQENRTKIVGLVDRVEEGSLPLDIYELSDPLGFEPEERALSVADARRLLGDLRGIELETQMNTQLEEGYITSPDQFEPYDEDWTEPPSPPGG